MVSYRIQHTTPLYIFGMENEATQSNNIIKSDAVYNGYPVNISMDVNQTHAIDNGFTNRGGGDFFDIYFSRPRFIAETILAAFSITSNTFALALVSRVFFSRQTPYHRLFINLAIANSLTSILSWLCNNIIFLFRRKIIISLFMGSTICELLVYLMAGVLASTAFGLVSTLTMLGFTAVQYIVIHRPLHHQKTIRHKRICCFIILTWILSISAAVVPFLLLLYQAKVRECNAAMLDSILNAVLIGSNSGMGIIIVAYFMIVALCVRIYVEIKSLQKRLSRFRFRKDISSERKAFLTIIILLLTLTVFYVPYMFVYLVTLNASDDINMKNDALVYYMNLLPYLKFCTDPIIYGMRMREIREGCWFFLRQCKAFNCSNEIRLLLPQSSSTVSTPVATAV